MLKTCFFSGPDIFLGEKLHGFSRLHSFILQVPSDCLQKGGIGLALILKICPFYPLQPALLRSASPIFFLGGIFVGQFIESNKNMVTFPGKNTHSVGRSNENAAQSDMSASGLRWRSWTCNRVATCATERTPGVNQIQGHAPKTVGMP